MHARLRNDCVESHLSTIGSNPNRQLPPKKRNEMPVFLSPSHCAADWFYCGVFMVKMWLKKRESTEAFRLNCSPRTVCKLLLTSASYVHSALGSGYLVLHCRCLRAEARQRRRRTAACWILGALVAMSKYVEKPFNGISSLHCFWPFSLAFASSHAS